MSLTLRTFERFWLGLCLLLGLCGLGYLLGKAAVQVKTYDRSVTVKGLSEREVPADIVIWPLSFMAAGNDLPGLYAALEAHTQAIRSFMTTRGIQDSEITVSSPVVTDKVAQSYGGQAPAEMRYSATQVVTVYSDKVKAVREVMKAIPALGKQGIAFTGDEFQTEYLFSGLNKLKPEMVQEATAEARHVAEKFAQDSSSRLGKIRMASQGQFTLEPRDRNNPHIKKIRVVSTIEYYLSD